MEVSDILFESKITSFMMGLRPDTPEKAVELWILGVKNRSGAVQFSLLSPSLQETNKEGIRTFGVILGTSKSVGRLRLDCQSK